MNSSPHMNDTIDFGSVSNFSELIEDGMAVLSTLICLSFAQNHAIYTLLITNTRTHTPYAQYTHIQHQIHITTSTYLKTLNYPHVKYCKYFHYLRSLSGTWPTL